MRKKGCEKDAKWQNLCQMVNSFYDRLFVLAKRHFSCDAKYCYSHHENVDLKKKNICVTIMFYYNTFLIQFGKDTTSYSERRKKKEEIGYNVDKSFACVASWKITFKFTPQISARFIKSARRTSIISHTVKPRYDLRGPRSCLSLSPYRDGGKVQ